MNWEEYANTEKQKSAFCADGCTLRTMTGTGSRLHRFRLCWLYTTENIMEEKDYEYCPNLWSKDGERR